MTDDTSPAYLRGGFAPVPDEIDAFDLPVTGALPPELSGRYVRNGPNPRPGVDPGHWFAGDGMLHGVRIADGRAHWYRNRWVRTGRFAGEPFLRDGRPDRTAVTANTHLVRHAGRTMALVESGFPHLIGPELETLGPCDFDGRLTTAMTAHPKQDPVTGDLHFFGYSVVAPFLTYHRLSAEGELVESRIVEIPGPTMMHDFAITAGHTVWLDLPVVFRRDAGGLSGVGYDESHGARIGVMPHGGPVRWFEVDPGYVFHVANAHEDADGRIVLDAPRYGPEDFAGVWGTATGTTTRQRADAAVARLGARMHRWILDPATGTVTERRLDDRTVEFPTVADSRVGRAGRFVYTCDDTAVVKYDLASGTTVAHELPDGRTPGEAVFVPAADGTAEDHGWLLTIDGDDAGSASRLLVLDAADPAGDPVAVVGLPRRVPTGFHGSWLPDPVGDR